jgi:hypothetical protein
MNTGDCKTIQKSDFRVAIAGLEWLQCLDKSGIGSLILCGSIYSPFMAPPHYPNRLWVCLDREGVPDSARHPY